MSKTDPLNDLGLTGRVVLVAGARRGLDRAYAHALARHEAHVVMHDAGLVVWRDSAEVDEKLYAPLSAVNNNAAFGVETAPFDFLWFTPRVEEENPCDLHAEQLKRAAERHRQEQPDD